MRLNELNLTRLGIEKKTTPLAERGLDIGSASGGQGGVTLNV